MPKLVVRLTVCALGWALCACEQAPLLDNPKLAEALAPKIAELQASATRPDLGFTPPRTPVEVALRAVLPQLAEVRWVCSRGGLGRAKTEYQVLLHDGRQASGSALRTCNGPLERAAVRVAGVGGAVTARTSGEEREVLFSDQLVTTVFNDLRAALDAAATSLHQQQGGAGGAPPSDDEIADSWR